MHGFVALLDTSPPQWLVIENSDELSCNDSHKDALNLFCYDLSSRGYDLRVFTCESDMFALPQGRSRTYIVGVMRPMKSFKLLDYTAFFNTIVKLMDVFKVPAVPLQDCLYDDDHPAVQRELQNRLSKNPAVTMMSKEMNEQRQAWKILGLRNLPGCERVRAADKNSPWFGTINLRKQTCFEIHQYKAESKVLARKKKLDELESDASAKPDKFDEASQIPKCFDFFVKY